jgi:hypothetical protein
MTFYRRGGLHEGSAPRPLARQSNQRQITTGLYFPLDEEKGSSQKFGTIYVYFSEVWHEKLFR